MLVGWVDLIRRPFAKRNDFASVDARNYPKNSKTYEMITSPPTTYVVPKTPDPLVKSPRPEEQHDEGMKSPLPNSPPSPSSQYTNDYFDNNNNHNHTKEPGSRRSPQLSFYLPPEADYKSPKLSFSTPRPPPPSSSSAGRSFFSPKDTHHARFQFHQHQNPQTVGRRPFSPPQTTTAAARRRESGGSSTCESAYEWDPTTTYAPPGTSTSSRVRSPSSYYGGVEAM